jgi:hypothetical protein
MSNPNTSTKPKKRLINCCPHALTKPSQKITHQIPEHQQNQNKREAQFQSCCPYAPMEQ